MEKARITHKVRDLSIGFFGWWLICSLGFLVSQQLGRGESGFMNGVAVQDPSLGLIWDYVFPVVTAIVIGVLFYKRNNWFAYGIFVAIIINTLIWVLLNGDDTSLRMVLSTPFFSIGGFY
jgi:hypothetical protein